jgi:hypothetical protein
MLKTLLRYIYILSVLVGIHACSGSPQELITAERLMETAPDSALHILQNLSGNKLHGRYNRAMYALLMTQALNKKDSVADNDSLISLSTDYFDESDPVHAGYAWFYQSRIDAKQDSVNTQTRSLFEAQEYAEKTSDYKLRGLVYGDKADMYASQNQNDSSICYYKKANHSFLLISDYRNSILALFSIASEFMKKSQLDSVRYYYQLAGKISSKTNDKLLVSYIYRNIGITYFQEHNYSIALHNYWSVPVTQIKIYDSNKYYLLGRLYVKTQQLDSAQYYLRKVTELGEMAPDYYRLWESVYEQKGDRIRALEYANKVSIATDSLYKMKLEKSFAGLEKKYKFQGLQITNKNLTIKNKQRGFLLLLALLTLSIFIALFLYWRLKVRKNEVEYQKTLVENEKALVEKEKALVEKEKEKTEKERENNVLLEKQLKFQSILLLNLEQHRNHSAKQTGLWGKKKNETSPVENKTFNEELIACMDMEYNNISQRLKEKFPDLSKNDIVTCCLMLAGFETGMIATILNVQIESVFTRRFRIRKKLNIEESVKLEVFLERF